MKLLTRPTGSPLPFSYGSDSYVVGHHLLQEVCQDFSFTAGQFPALCPFPHSLLGECFFSWCVFPTCCPPFLPGWKILEGRTPSRSRSAPDQELHTLR